MKYVLAVSMLLAVGCSTNQITKDSRHLICVTPIGALEATATPGILEIKDLGDSYQVTDVEQKKQIVVAKSSCVLFRDAE